MNILYIGDYSYGSTSAMRCNVLQELYPEASLIIADISKPLYKTNAIFRSIGWRFQKGPLIKEVNEYILNFLTQNYDITWIDKGMFINHFTINKIRKQSKLLIHYTPDMAFFSNASAFFNRSIPVYDLCITTKRVEIDLYKQKGVKKLHFTTQGYNPLVHKPFHTFDQKQGVVFIGLNEPSRERIITSLLENAVPVILGGSNWNKFVKKHNHIKDLSFLGEKVYSEAYAQALSGSLVGLGLLSKRFKELHTTRTFEIPACGTALISERTQDTVSFFDDSEAIFYKNEGELITQIKYYLKHQDKLEEITKNGYRKVTTHGLDYKSIIQNALKEIGI